MAKKIDWTQAKADFIADQKLSLEQLAKNYVISYNRMRTVAGKEKWTEQRKKSLGNVESKVIDKVENTMADMIIRQTKIAGYLQSAGIKYLKLLLDEIEDLMSVGNEVAARKLIKQLIFNKIISPGILMEMVGEGSKIERELHPKQLQVEVDAKIEGEGISVEMEEVVYDALRAKLGRKRDSIHKGKRNKKPVKK